MYKLINFRFPLFPPPAHSCKERDQYAKGCQTVSQSPFQMGLATTLDPARDLQRLNTLIVSNLEDLKLFNEPKSAFIQEITTPEDLKLLHKNAMALMNAAVSLQNIHMTYRSLLVREMQYGSRSAPIGDDNYLHLMRGGGLANATTVAHASTLPILKHHHSLTIEHSPRHFIRNDLLRSSLANDKLTHY